MSDLTVVAVCDFVVDGRPFHLRPMSESRTDGEFLVLKSEADERIAELEAERHAPSVKALLARIDELEALVDRYQEVHAAAQGAIGIMRLPDPGAVERGYFYYRAKRAEIFPEMGRYE